MNEFIEQFIIEARELVEQGTAALASLEDSPRNAEALDALFRALHTLKGSAGIVDFAAMEFLLHEVEGALGRMRANSGVMPASANADCLACLDLVGRWLDAMERSGDTPAGAAAQAAAVLERFSGSAKHAAMPNVARMEPEPRSWLEVLQAQHPELSGIAHSALRYTPKRDCFLRGEDPLALVASLPGLLALDLQPDGAWPQLDTLDAYECCLVLTALSAASAQDTATYLKEHATECEVRTLGTGAATAAAPGLSNAARALLAAQVALLADVNRRAFAGIVAAAGTTAANALACCGLHAAAAAVRRATRQSLDENSALPLRAQIVQALDAAAEPAPPLAEPAPPAPELTARPELATRMLRIDAAKVEALVRLIGELTVVKNALGHLAHLAQADGNALARALKLQHGTLERITSEAQGAVLGMRVLPLRTVLGRFPPVMRDMAAALGKPVKLLIEGEATEADKAIVEMLFEPLLHVLRNAMDHGIETPALRARGNKPPVATIAMRASRQGDRVLLDISDDGKGLDVERIREVAAERGLVSAEGLAELGDAGIADLVFAPGFSTATTVTELSGRGVGMDAVRTAVGRVGGSVSIESHAGLGTRVRFSLPFSVMMTRVMTVEAGGQSFGIPLDSVSETLRVPLASLAGIGTAQAIVHRNRTLPVFALADLLQVQAPTAGAAQDAIIVVTTFAGQWGALRVDRLGERMDVMLKPLDGLLAGVRAINGTTIMGDGRVLLVLDMGELLL